MCHLSSTASHDHQNLHFTATQAQHCGSVQGYNTELHLPGIPYCCSSCDRPNAAYQHCIGPRAPKLCSLAAFCPAGCPAGMQARCALPLLRIHILHQETVCGMAIWQHSRLVRALLSVCLWFSPALNIVNERVALKRISPGQ